MGFVDALGQDFVLQNSLSCETSMTNFPDFDIRERAFSFASTEYVPRAPTPPSKCNLPIKKDSETCIAMFARELSTPYSLKHYEFEDESLIQVGTGLTDDDTCVDDESIFALRKNRTSLQRRASVLKRTYSESTLFDRFESPHCSIALRSGHRIYVKFYPEERSRKSLSKRLLLFRQKICPKQNSTSKRKQQPHNETKRHLPPYERIPDAACSRGCRTKNNRNPLALIRRLWKNYTAKN